MDGLLQPTKAQADDLKSQIAQTDKEIHEMVYRLVDEEVMLVENTGN